MAVERCVSCGLILGSEDLEPGGSCNRCVREAVRQELLNVVIWGGDEQKFVEVIASCKNRPTWFGADELLREVERACDFSKRHELSRVVREAQREARSGGGGGSDRMRDPPSMGPPTSRPKQPISAQDTQRASARPDVNAEDESLLTELWKACSEGEANLVLAFIAKGADVNAKDQNGSTALSKACSEGDVNVIAVLIAAGADVNEKDQSGRTALLKACSKGDVKAATALIAGGAEIDAKDQSGETALMKAAQNERVKCVNALIIVGAEVNANDHSGRTALMLAASKGAVSSVKALVAAGADVNARDSYGWTALSLSQQTRSLSQQTRHREVAAILLGKLPFSSRLIFHSKALIAYVSGLIIFILNLPSSLWKRLRDSVSKRIAVKKGVGLPPPKTASQQLNTSAGNPGIGITSPTMSRAWLSTDTDTQSVFDRLWVEATREHMKLVRDGRTVDEVAFVKDYVFQRMIAKHDLEAVDFANLEMNFRLHWHPSFAEGWEQNDEPHGARSAGKRGSKDGTTPPEQRGDVPTPGKVSLRTGPGQGVSAQGNARDCNISVTGGLGGDNEADRQRMVRALESLDFAFPGKMSPSNVKMAFNAYASGEPGDFDLQLVNLTLTGAEAIRIQEYLVSALKREGLKV